MQKVVLILSLAAGAFTACTDSPTSAPLESRNAALDINTLEAIDCGTSGEFVSFRMEATEAVDVAKVNIEGVGAQQLTAPGSANGSNVRLDTCFSDAPTLKRVVYKAPDASNFTILAVAGDSVVTGLQDAVFGEAADLHIEIAHENTQRFYIKGWGSAGESFVTAGFVDGSSDRPRLRSAQLIAGRFAFGDPFSLCDSPGDLKVARFSLDTARFEVTGCSLVGTSGGFGLDVKKIVVTDSNTALPAAAREAFVVEGLAIADRFTEVVQHHNACDSFYLKLPHAEYAATSATMADEMRCGTVHPQAPQLADEATLGAFRIRYGSGAWKDFKATFKHYFQDHI